MATQYHEGEIAVQERVGVRHSAGKVANGIRDFMLPAAREFLEVQPFVVAAIVHDRDNSVWAVPVRGPLSAVDDRTIRVPTNLSGAVGIVIMDFATRRRMRINGDAANGLLTIQQCYANCPKYIQKRALSTTDSSSETAAMPILPSPQSAITEAQAEWIRRSDTFFIATHHPVGGTDASHRGGNPGFVAVSVAHQTLAWADFSGNSMFNTLGNIVENPETGLFFPDFTTGNALLLSGTAKILWHDSGDRSVAFTIRQVVEVPEAFVVAAGTTVEYSPFNP